MNIFTGLLKSKGLPVTVETTTISPFTYIRESPSLQVWITWTHSFSGVGFDDVRLEPEP